MVTVTSEHERVLSPPPLVTLYHNEVSHSSLLIHIFPRERTYDNQRVQISNKFNTYEAYVV